MISRRSLLKSLFFGPKGTPSLVVVFLRGGADGLNLVVPKEEKDYFFYRPTLAIKDTLPLDNQFGFNEAFEKLHPYYTDKRLAIVHAVGSDDQTRSHFEAQDLMERAGRTEDGAAGGWLARHLRAKKGPTGALSAISLTRTMPEVLRGAPSACAMESIDRVALPNASPEFTQALRVMYNMTGVTRPGLSLAWQVGVPELCDVLRAEPPAQKQNVEFWGLDTFPYPDSNDRLGCLRLAARMLYGLADNEELIDDREYVSGVLFAVMLKMTEAMCCHGPISTDATGGAS